MSMPYAFSTPLSSSLLDALSGMDLDGFFTSDDLAFVAANDSGDAPLDRFDVQHPMLSPGDRFFESVAPYALVWGVRAAESSEPLSAPSATLPFNPCNALLATGHEHEHVYEQVLEESHVHDASSDSGLGSPAGSDSDLEDPTYQPSSPLPTRKAPKTSPRKSRKTPYVTARPAKKAAANSPKCKKEKIQHLCDCCQLVRAAMARRPRGAPILKVNPDTKELYWVCEVCYDKVKNKKAGLRKWIEEHLDKKVCAIKEEFIGAKNKNPGSRSYEQYEQAYHAEMLAFVAQANQEQRDVVFKLDAMMYLHNIGMVYERKTKTNDSDSE